MNLALKVRLYPTLEQQILINMTLGCCRQIYNLMLAERLNFYDENIRDKDLTKEQKSEIYKSYKPKTEKEYKAEYEYMKDVSSVSLQQSRRDMETAFGNFYKGKSKFPRFHSKKNKNSYREVMSVKFFWNKRTIQLPKLGEVKFRNRELPRWLHIDDKVCNITVSKTPSGKYFASILFEIAEMPKTKSENQAIGLDFSPASVYITSDGLSGSEFGYIPQKQIHLRQLRKLERRLARKQKGSRNRKKARIKVARMEEHIANSRKDWIEKETLRLVRNYNVIGIEDLTIRGLMRASRNARNYVDASWGTFTTKLIDKSKRSDCNVVKADRFFASSKLCHVCGYKKKDLTLGIRHWQCPCCKTEHNRDMNAAINLKNNAINVLLEGQEFRSVKGIEGLADVALVYSGVSAIQTERDVS